jgi:L-alanine-DL-glutamate epimerase-like enolase superfamily enzyme
MSSGIPRITGFRTIGLKRGSGPVVTSGTNTDTLIEVQTDVGIVGRGSSYTSQDLVDGALALLHDQIVGEIAIEPERVSEKLHQMTYWTGRGGSVTHAISGLDIALWDVLGQIVGQPIGRLMGGRYVERIKPYGSLIFAEPEQLRERLLAGKSRGFRAFKLGWGPFGRRSDAYDELLVKTARETVGDDCEIMVDPGGSVQFWPHGLKWALRTAEMLASHGVVWFEEALPPDDLEGYRELRRGSKLFISAGEVLTRRQSFRPWLESGALDIVQPDVTKVGGLSEGRRIGWMAHDHNVLLVPHGFNTAVGVAADLQLVSAIPGTRWIEYITPSPLIEGILATPFTLDADGMLPIPDGPGLGIDLDPDGLKALSVGRA